ncbi:2-phosphosulfolactate phosphatase [Neobacillus niacini]|uniref:2-phosphosulfolactate phosphatase n=1 Tax=Neobacillus driksii TaxID=3035913 RepID=UPI002788D3F8|nr:2-phosphosulfolactate phosphatase [Neobacillus niacini]MDQ0970570.1 2-phosphosulfolactate phosphatase [Neobacillus niacini]
MRKIHVITQKELVDSEMIRNCTAVVIDVLLATSTITYLLEKGYEPVYAVKDALSALDIVKKQNSPYLLMGEWQGESIENFNYPDPMLIETTKIKQPAIICSTNGTIAIEKAKQAKALYASSLINGHTVAEHIRQQDDGSSIVLICSGNAGRLSMEDFIGSGQIIDHLTRNNVFELSDAARLARDSFVYAKSKQFVNLLESETAGLLRRTGYERCTQWVIDHVEKVDVVPVYRNGRLYTSQIGRERSECWLHTNKKDLFTC